RAMVRGVGRAVEQPGPRYGRGCRGKHVDDRLIPPFADVRDARYQAHELAPDIVAPGTAAAQPARGALTARDDCLIIAGRSGRTRHAAACPIPHAPTTRAPRVRRT